MEAAPAGNEPLPRWRIPRIPTWARWTLAVVLAFGMGLWIRGCVRHEKPTTIRPGDRLERRGDEIVVCGQLFHTGAPVILWTDPGGYDAYRFERRYSPYSEASWAATTQKTRDFTTPNRYNLRSSVLSKEQIDLVRGGGWPLELLQEKVDQFVIHYDVAGVSRRCFQILHDQRTLSVHFMLDVDGTIYQTLDLKERAWHAGSANSQSIGIEIANIGAYTPGSSQDPLDQWYKADESGLRALTLPGWIKESGIRTPGFVARPYRNDPVTGTIQGRTLRMYDLTAQQYDSLIKLTAAVCTALPKIKCDYPRDENGNLITQKLSDEQLKTYQGLLGHYHLTQDKIDPGPAFQWDLVIDGARKLMKK
ncbi:MAG TPA: N-acetylmuramoyl-L-alanine amidase [Tepidisphaeraceae bacterium]|nr:N-acetylmuramoyl-L-alanine amidase [Tepidisphaeraceae bacterium]